MPELSELVSPPLIKSQGTKAWGGAEEGEAQVLTPAVHGWRVEYASASKIRGCWEFPGGPMTGTLTPGAEFDP